MRNPERAAVAVEARVTQGDTNVSRDFGTTFAIRNYSIDVSGESPRSGQNVPMPPPTTLSFDTTYGAERMNEKARVLAGDIVEKVKAFAGR